MCRFAGTKLTEETRIPKAIILGEGFIGETKKDTYLKIYLHVLF